MTIPPPPPPPTGSAQLPPASPGWAAQPGRPAPLAVSEPDRTWAIIAHLSAFVALLASATLFSFLGPFVVWLIRKDSSAFVRHAAAGSFNFNVSMSLIAWLAALFAVFTLGLGLVVAVPLWAAQALLMLWCHIRASIKAGQGELYEYPLQIPILRWGPRLAGGTATGSVAEDRAVEDRPAEYGAGVTTREGASPPCRPAGAPCG